MTGLEIIGALALLFFLTALSMTWLAGIPMYLIDYTELSGGVACAISFVWVVFAFGVLTLIEDKYYSIGE